VAIGAAITAFVQIHRRRQTGLGMAIAGIVLAAVWTAVGIGVGIGFLLNQTTVNGALGRVADTEVATVGSCLQEPGAQDSVATEIDCAQDHDAEVYLVDDLGAGVWPGYDEVDANADAACYDAFEGYVGNSWEWSDFDYGYFLPDQAEWALGEHRVVCVVVPGLDEALRGSVRGSGR
jgi:hypothetical protein